MEKPNPHRFYLDQLKGQFDAWLAEFWFKFLGYCLVTGGVFSVAEIANSLPLSIVKWGCLFALYFWLRFQVEKAFFYIWPETEPDWRYSPRTWQLYVTNTLIAPLVYLAFRFGVEIAEVVAKISG